MAESRMAQVAIEVITQNSENDSNLATLAIELVTSSPRIELFPRTVQFAPEPST